MTNCVCWLKYLLLSPLYHDTRKTVTLPRTVEWVHLYTSIVCVAFSTQPINRRRQMKRYNECCVQQNTSTHWCVKRKVSCSWMYLSWKTLCALCISHLITVHSIVSLCILLSLFLSLIQLHTCISYLSLQSLKLLQSIERQPLLSWNVSALIILFISTNTGSSWLSLSSSPSHLHLPFPKHNLIYDQNKHAFGQTTKRQNESSHL